MSTTEITTITASFDGIEDFNISTADLFGQTDPDQIARELLIGARDNAAENDTDAPTICTVELGDAGGTTTEGVAWVDGDQVAFGADATLFDAATGDAIRPATVAELVASIKAAESDGGAGTIEVDGRRVWAK